MKKKVLLVLLPVFVGLSITALALAIPAQASQPQNWMDPEHGFPHQVYGTVESFPDQLVGEWVVNGVAYTATAHTEFDQEHGPFAVGACVEVVYMPFGMGGEVNLALKIQTESAYKCEGSPNPLSEATGVVISFPVNLVGTWVVDTATYTATTNTRFEQDEGPFMVGGCVEVKFVTETHAAIEIATQDAEECGGEGELQLFGLIDQAPPETQTITSTWVISGIEFISTPETELETEHGPLVAGACAKVEYHVLNGLNYADEISSEWLFRCLGSGALNQVFGAVVSYPPDLFGTWVISATNDGAFMFLTDPATRFTGRFWEISIGSCVMVKYFTQDGVNHAVQVSVNHGNHCEQTQPPSLSELIVTVETRPTGTLTGTWTFAGLPFTATTATRFDDHEGDLMVGDCVEAKYDPAGGAMLLKRVEEEHDFRCQAHNGSPLFRLFGFVDIMPGGGAFTGTWQVSGVPVEAISTTLFEQHHGVFAVGAFVEVKFTFDAGTGMRTATDIETHVAPGFGRRHHFGHLEHIQLGSAPNEYDIWTVDGVAYLADPAMEASLDLKVGDLVAVNAYEDAGNLFATRIAAVTPLYLPMISR